MTRSPEELEEAKQRRQQTSDDLVNSDARKKLVVAGPGTGKTHNFKRDLGDLAQVNTFHGYCKHLAHNFGGVGGLTAKFDYFPGLPELVAEDLEIRASRSRPWLRGGNSSRLITVPTMETSYVRDHGSFEVAIRPQRDGAGPPRRLAFTCDGSPRDSRH